jgi:hypothetical protein
MAAWAFKQNVNGAEELKRRRIHEATSFSIAQNFEGAQDLKGRKV